MVFPSVPVYLDPLNWPQQQTYQHSGVGAQNPQLSNPPQPPPSTVAVGGGGQQHQGSDRPGSMADRARLAKIQPPEEALKCPRCESTNTKFCYYNNYSLLQPRHFCKTCRRYWTRGGAMRNVPVGGGCRRNKRSKGSSSRSKSPIKDDPQASSSCTARANSSSTCTTNAIGHLPTLAPSQMPLFPTSHYYNDYFSKGMGLHFGAIPPPVVVANGNTASSIGFEFQIGTSSGANNCDSVLPNGLIEQWRLPNQQVHQQQFPFLSDLETQAQIGLFQFEGENVDEQLSYVGDRSRLRSKTSDSDSSVREMPHQVSSVRKVDENQGFSLSKNLLGSSGNDQFWAASGNTWNNIPSFTSSTSHLL